MFQNSNLLLTIFIIWNCILSGFSLWLYFKFQKLFKGAAGENLKTTLEKNLLESNDLRKRLLRAENKIEILNKEKVSNLKKSAFLRFNPFNDTGGNQSFVWACLDEENNGIILSSLHNRDSTRMYAKEIKKGLPYENRLSEEEQQVLNIAKKQTALVKNDFLI